MQVILNLRHPVTNEVLFELPMTIPDMPKEHADIYMDGIEARLMQQLNQTIKE